MIKLIKLAKPEILTKNAETWTAELLDKIKENQKPSSTDDARYRHPQIKESLISETNGKCAYCESKLRHVHHGDVEHIIPKSLQPSKRYEWDNLTLACEICNQNKSNKDPDTLHIIDPYTTNPKEHLIFVGALLYSLGTTHGTNTKTLLGLNRVELIEQRQNRLNQIMGIFESIFNNQLALETRKAILTNLLTNDCSAKSEYSAMIIATVESLKSKLPPELQNIQQQLDYGIRDL